MLAHCRPRTCRSRQARTSSDSLPAMLDYCCCHRCSNISWSLTCWTVCRMSGTWDGPVRGGLAAGDLVAGLCCPLPVKLQPSPVETLLSGLRPAACSSRCPTGHARIQNFGSNCVRLPAIAGAHPDMHKNKRVKASCSTRHASLPAMAATPLCAAERHLLQFCHQRL